MLLGRCLLAIKRTGAAEEYGCSGPTHFANVCGSDNKEAAEARRVADAGWSGLSWAVGGWLLTPFLAKLGAEGAARLRQRVADELKTTFASRYTSTISLKDALNPAIIAAYAKKATGEKFLINPNK